MPWANKKVRTSQGWRTYKVRFSDPGTVAKAKPEDVWRDGDGREIVVQDMDIKHLANAMRVMENRNRAVIKATMAAQQATELKAEEIDRIMRALSQANDAARYARHAMQYPSNGHRNP